MFVLKGRYNDAVAHAKECGDRTLEAERCLIAVRDECIKTVKDPNATDQAQQLAHAIFALSECR